VPDEFPPSAHTHTESEITDLDKYTQSQVDTLLTWKENTITAGTTSQYYRWDKTFQTLDKTAVWLSNVDNTSDINKPISTATQTALDWKLSTTLSSGRILIWNASNVATQTPISWDATMSNTGAITIANDAVTFAKMQNISQWHLIGRHSSGSGDPEQVGLGWGIELSGANISVARKNSIEIDSGEIQLVGDNATPWNSRYYGTDWAGTKGFHTLPTGWGGSGWKFVPKNSINSAQRYVLRDHASTSSWAATPSAQRLHYVPFVLQRTSTITEIWAQVTTAWWWYMMLGIYDSLNDLPNNRLFETAQLPLTWWYQSEAVSQVLNAWQLYRTAIAVRQASGSAQLRSMLIANVNNLLGMENNSALCYTHYYETLSNPFSNLPTTASSLTALSW